LWDKSLEEPSLEEACFLRQKKYCTRKENKINGKILTNSANIRLLFI
jgi:hypothetical protein